MKQEEKVHNGQYAPLKKVTQPGAEIPTVTCGKSVRQYCLG